MGTRASPPAIVKKVFHKEKTNPSQKVVEFIKNNKPSTPFLVMDLDVVANNYNELHRTLPIAEIFYAVKANPAPEIVQLLTTLGSSFDVASPAEIHMVLDAGVRPEKVSFGNTIKKERDIAFAFERGVRMFAFDSISELEKISRAAPGSKVFCRLLTSNEGADWPLSRKFGCDEDMAFDLLLKARELGLEPYGISFHVGSQQTRLDQWNGALQKTAELFLRLKNSGVALSMVNIGGGLPAHYTDPVSSVAEYSKSIMSALKECFSDTLPLICTEPGRSLVGDAGVLETEVILISKKSYADEARWVYVDIGKFGGLAETHDEAIKYRIDVVDKKGPAGPVILAGPSCDSVDILYEKFQYQLPLSLQAGDHLRFYAAGAYTASYASVGFNGFAPLKTFFI